jgi:hypothetical protein
LQTGSQWEDPHSVGNIRHDTLFYTSASCCTESSFVVPTSVYNATIFFDTIHTLFTKMLVKIHMSLIYVCVIYYLFVVSYCKPLPPGKNPFAVNKHYITLQNISTTCFNLTGSSSSGNIIIDPLHKRKIMLPEDDTVRSKHFVDIF